MNMKITLEQAEKTEEAVFHRKPSICLNRGMQ